jgi:hypothetical protein
VLIPSVMFCVLAVSAAQPAPSAEPLLVVLSDTGRQQDGRAIVERIDAP